MNNEISQDVWAVAVEILLMALCTYLRYLKRTIDIPKYLVMAIFFCSLQMVKASFQIAGIIGCIASFIFYIMLMLFLFKLIEKHEWKKLSERQ